MEMSKPSAKVLYDYLLNMGHEWVMETYSLSWEEIDDILYGSALPTKERQEKKLRVQRRIDEAKGVYIENFKYDHFIWEEPTSKHMKCMEADDADVFRLSEDEKILWRRMYVSAMSKFMSKSNNGMKTNGWSLGEKVINKTTSKTKDDIIHDIYLRMLVYGNLMNHASANRYISCQHAHKKHGHNLVDESFVDSMQNTEDVAWKDLGGRENETIRHVGVREDSLKTKASDRLDEVKLKGLQWRFDDIIVLDSYYRGKEFNVRFACKKCNSIRTKPYKNLYKNSISSVCCEGLGDYDCGLYILSVDGEKERFLKVGVSKDPLRRAVGITSHHYKATVIARVDTNSYQARHLERFILDWFKHKQYTPKHDLDGKTECIIYESLSDVLDFCEKQAKNRGLELQYVIYNDSK